MINFDVPDLLVALLVAILVAAQINAYCRLTKSDKPIPRLSRNNAISRKVCRVKKGRSESYGFTLVTVNVETINHIVPGSSAEQSGLGSEY